MSQLSATDLQKRLLLIGNAAKARNPTGFVDEVKRRVGDGKPAPPPPPPEERLSWVVLEPPLASSASDAADACAAEAAATLRGSRAPARSSTRSAGASSATARTSWFFASSNQRPGFDAADVRAICDVNASTKAGDAATTGHKGIGFKAVFAMCDRPCVLSNGFAFYFDAERDGPLGLVAPRWLELDGADGAPAPPGDVAPPPRRRRIVRRDRRVRSSGPERPAFYHAVLPVAPLPASFGFSLSAPFDLVARRAPRRGEQRRARAVATFAAAVASSDELRGRALDYLGSEDRAEPPFWAALRADVAARLADRPLLPGAATAASTARRPAAAPRGAGSSASASARRSPTPTPSTSRSTPPRRRRRLGDADLLRAWADDADLAARCLADGRAAALRVPAAAGRAAPAASSSRRRSSARAVLPDGVAGAIAALDGGGAAAAALPDERAIDDGGRAAADGAGRRVEAHSTASRVAEATPGPGVLVALGAALASAAWWRGLSPAALDYVADRLGDAATLAIARAAPARARRGGSEVLAVRDHFLRDAFAPLCGDALPYLFDDGGGADAYPGLGAAAARATPPSRASAQATRRRRRRARGAPPLRRRSRSAAGPSTASAARPTTSRPRGRAPALLAALAVPSRAVAVADVDRCPSARRCVLSRPRLAARSDAPYIVTEILHGLAHAIDDDHGDDHGAAAQALYAHALPRLIGGAARRRR
ncbi:hypothetical protein JL721_3946 [Aureococcus anophagefferens]|nr:hypothetical protein JL721_3946 [Aureococcus anophagefferens]